MRPQSAQSLSKDVEDETHTPLYRLVPRTLDLGLPALDWSRSKLEQQRSEAGGLRSGMRNLIPKRTWPLID